MKRIFALFVFMAFSALAEKLCDNAFEKVAALETETRSVVTLTSEELRQSHLIRACGALETLRKGTAADPINSLYRMWQYLAKAGEKDTTILGVSEGELDVLVKGWRQKRAAERLDESVKFARKLRDDFFNNKATSEEQIVTFSLLWADYVNAAESVITDDELRRDIMKVAQALFLR